MDAARQLLHLRPRLIDLPLRLLRVLVRARRLDPVDGLDQGGGAVFGDQVLVVLPAAGQERGKDRREREKGAVTHTGLGG